MKKDNQTIINEIKDSIKKGSTVKYLQEFKIEKSELPFKTNYEEHTRTTVIAILKYLDNAPEKPLHNKPVLFAAFKMVSTIFNIKAYENDIKASEKILLEDLPETLKNDEEVFNVALQHKHTATCLKWAGWKLKLNKPYFDKIVQQYHGVYQWANKTLQEAPDFFIEALKKDLSVLQFAPRSIQDNETLVKLSIQYYPSNLIHATPRLYNKRELALPIVQNNPDFYKKFSIFCDDFDITLMAVKHNGENLSGASEDLKNNIDIVQAALENDPSSLLYAGFYFANHFPSAIKFQSEIKNINPGNSFEKKKLAIKYGLGLIAEIKQAKIDKEVSELNQTVQQKNSTELDLLKKFITELNLIEQFEVFKNKKKSIIKL